MCLINQPKRKKDPRFLDEGLNRFINKIQEEIGFMKSEKIDKHNLKITFGALFYQKSV